MQMLRAAILSALAFAWSGAAAFAFTDEPTPAGPGVQSQFSDPDEAVENLANGAAGGNGTVLTTGAQLPSAAAPTVPPTRGDAEPVNPNWPAWMVWHQN